MSQTGLYPAASQWFNSPDQGYFPGQTVAGFTPFQQQGWDQSISNLEGAVGTAGQQAQQGQQAWNKYNAFDPFNNPALDQSVQSMQTQMQKGYDRSVPLQQQQNAVDAGGYGGSRQGIAEGIARGDFLDTMAQKTADMYSNAYNQGLGRQTSLLQSMPNMMQASNALAMGQHAAGNDLAAGYGNIGAAQQAMNQNRINSDMARWQYEQQAPVNKLNTFAGLLQPGLGVGGSSTMTNPNVSNPFANALGGATAGAGLYDAWQGIDWPDNSNTGMYNQGGFQGLGIGNPGSYGG